GTPAAKSVGVSSTKGAGAADAHAGPIAMAAVATRAVLMKRPCRMWFSLVLRRPGGAGLAPSGRQETDGGLGRCLVAGRVAGGGGDLGHQRAMTRQAYARVLAHLQGDVGALGAGDGHRPAREQVPGALEAHDDAARGLGARARDPDRH